MQENSSYNGKGGLTEKMQKRLISSARCAIRMRNKEPDKRRAVELLERDLLNGPSFGIHDVCSSDFCSVVKEREEAVRRDSEAARQQHEDNCIVDSRRGQQ